MEIRQKPEVGKKKKNQGFSLFEKAPHDYYDIEKDMHLLQKESLTENSTHCMVHRITSMQQLVLHLKLLVYKYRIKTLILHP